MNDSAPQSSTLSELLLRLEGELELCDELGLSSVAIDLNQAIEKLKAVLGSQRRSEP